MPEPGPTVTARHVTMGWGTSGVWGEGPPPAWVIGLVDVEASEPLEGLRLESLRVLDASGRVLARADSELELRRCPPGRAERDFSRYGTEDFSGTVPALARLRLWVHGRLDVSYTELGTAPARYEATFAAASGEPLRVEGPLDPPWPTA